MNQLFGIISEYKDQLTMLPTMIIIFVTATLLCYIAFSMYRWVKYIPGLVGIVLGVINLFRGWQVFTTLEGLDIMWKAIYFFVAGCIALGTAWIVALLSWSDRRVLKEQRQAGAALKKRKKKEKEAEAASAKKGGKSA